MGLRGQGDDPRPLWWLFTLFALPSFGKGNGNGLIFWVAFFGKLADVFGHSFLRFAFT